MEGSKTASELISYLVHEEVYIKPEMMSRKQPLSCPQHA